MFGHVGKQGAAADLLLALDHDPDAHGRPPVPGPQRSGESDDVRLGIGGPPPIDGPVALGRLEGGRVPFRLVTGGNHVVVAVEEHGRSSGGCGDLRHDEGRRVGQVDGLHLLAAGFSEQLRDGVAGLEERRPCLLRIAGLGDGWYGDQFGKLVLESGHQLSTRPLRPAAVSPSPVP